MTHNEWRQLIVIHFSWFIHVILMIAITNRLTARLVRLLINSWVRFHILFSLFHLSSLSFTCFLGHQPSSVPTVMHIATLTSSSIISTKCFFLSFHRFSCPFPFRWIHKYLKYLYDYFLSLSKKQQDRAFLWNSFQLCHVLVLCSFCIYICIVWLVCFCCVLHLF